MKAAIINSFGQVPGFGDFDAPVARQTETLIKVHAAPLSPIVRALASGQHYTSAKTAGFVPGVDGVGIDSQGRRVYFLFPRPPFGSMAELSLVSRDMVVPVPDALSDIEAAAIASSGLASWIALTRRAPIKAGATVLINGVTGAAGAMAVQVARHLGAGRVVGVGRNSGKLARMGVDVGIALDATAGDVLRAEFRRGVDVVLDFVWGQPATQILEAATTDRGSRDGEPRLRYVQIGTAAGTEIPLRGDALRSSGLELLGSGIGSVSIHDLLEGAGELLIAASTAGFNAPVTPLPLSAIAEAWNSREDTRYILRCTDQSR